MSSTTEAAARGAPERPAGAGAWPYALVLLAAAALFAPFLIQGKVFLAADTLRAYYPWRAGAPPGFRPHNPLITDPLNANWPGVYNEQLKRGAPASWNPSLLTGIPATGATPMAGAPGRAFPLKLLLHRFLPPVTAFMVLNLLYVALMGCTMLAFLAAAGAGRAGALFGATAYMLNGYLMVWLEFESVAASGALLPLVLLCAERWSGGRRWAWALGGALALGSVALMGMPQYVLQGGLLLGAYTLFLAAREARRAGWRAALPLPLGLAVAALGAALIAGVELLPLRETIAASSRVGREFDFAGLFDALGRIHPAWLATLVFPHFFGGPTLGWHLFPGAIGEYTNFNEMTLYLGVPALAALGAALAAPRRGRGPFFLGAAALTLTMLAGAWTYRPLFHLVPGMDRTAPLRLAFLFAFTASAAAGFGVRALEELGPRGRRAATALLAGFGAAALLFALQGGDAALARRLSGETLAALGAAGESLLAELPRLRGPATAIVLKPLALLAAASALWVAFLHLPRRRAPLLGALLVLLGYDLVSFGWGYNTFARPEEVYPTTPALEFLRRQPGPFRVAAQGGAFLPNSLAPYGIEEAGGYSSFYPDRAGRLLSLTELGPAAGGENAFGRWVTLRNLGSPLLPMMNVRYHLTAPGAPPADPRLRLAYDGEIRVWEDPAALPRAFVVPGHLVRPGAAAALAALAAPGFDPRRQVVLEEEPDPAFLASPARAEVAPGARVVRHAPDEVLVAAELPRRGWLVLTDAWYPGWEAEVDGAPRRILLANANFRALPLEAGRHEVRFRFRPRSVRLGLLCSLAGLAAVLAGLLLALRRRPAAPGGAAAAVTADGDRGS